MQLTRHLNLTSSPVGTGTMQGSYVEYSDAVQLVKDPLVSVVMLTYNHERYLAEAIEGVIRQQASFPIELIIGEDCSTDGTRKVALGYQKRFPDMIRVIASEQNVGMHKNGARLMAAARGKYMAFCEGDDFWHRSDKLQMQVAVLESHPDVSLVCSSYRGASESGLILSDDVFRLQAREERLTYEQLALGGAIYVETLTACARTQAVKIVLSTDSLCNDHTLLMGDLPLWLELCQLGQVMILRETLATYRLSPNSAKRQNDPLWGLHFAMSVLEVRYRALDRYPLPGEAGKTTLAKVRLARRLLLGSARVGNASLAQCQWRRLRSLSAKGTWVDAACVAIASIPLPRRRLTVALRRSAGYLKKLGVNRTTHLRPFSDW